MDLILVTSGTVCELSQAMPKQDCNCLMWGDPTLSWLRAQMNTPPASPVLFSQACRVSSSLGHVQNVESVRAVVAHASWSCCSLAPIAFHLVTIAGLSATAVLKAHPARHSGIRTISRVLVHCGEIAADVECRILLQRGRSLGPLCVHGEANEEFALVDTIACVDCQGSGDDLGAGTVFAVSLTAVHIIL